VILPGSEEWHPDHLQQVIAFERKLARRLPVLIRSMATASGYGNGRDYAANVPTDAPFALSRAAELAFATGRTKLALNVCASLVDATYAAPRTPMQRALWATAGVLTSQIRAEFGGSGVEVTYRPGSRRRHLGIQTITVPWPQTAIEQSHLACAFMAAAAVNDTKSPIPETRVSFETQPRLSSAALAAIQNSAEYRAALSIGMGRFDLQDEGQALGFASLELNYTRRLDLMRSSPAWKSLRVRGSIIDWVLLGLLVVRARRSHTQSAELGHSVSADTTFLRSLAVEIAETTPRDRVS
jgi:hypothetical protein